MSGIGAGRPRVTTLVIDHDGRSYTVALKRVASARRFTLRVRAARGDVVLTLPLHGSAQAARVFAVRHAAWIAEKLAQLKQRTAFLPGSVIPVRGQRCRIVEEAGLRRRAWLDTTDAHLCVSAPADRVSETILAFLQGEARRDLTTAVTEHAGTVNRTVRAITLRDTRSRWGSCTSRGTLNFSWRLILAPPFVLDYLAAHEVAHLVHMNHSADFWTLARKLAPQIDEAEQWLKSNGAGLHFYGG